MTSPNPVGQPSRWARSGGEDELHEAARDVWVSRPFMSRCRKLINVSTADRVCFVDDISIVKKKVKNTSFETLFPKASRTPVNRLPLEPWHWHISTDTLQSLCSERIRGRGEISEEDETVHKWFEIRMLDVGFFFFFFFFAQGGYF